MCEPTWRRDPGGSRPISLEQEALLAAAETQLHFQHVRLDHNYTSFRYGPNREQVFGPALAPYFSVCVCVCEVDWKCVHTRVCVGGWVVHAMCHWICVVFCCHCLVELCANISATVLSLSWAGSVTYITVAPVAFSQIACVLTFSYYPYPLVFSQINMSLSHTSYRLNGIITSNLTLSVLFALAVAACSNGNMKIRYSFGSTMYWSK